MSPGRKSATLWRGRGRIANAKGPQADPPTRVEPWTAASSAKKAAGLGGQRLTVGRPTCLCPAPRRPGLGAWGAAAGSARIRPGRAAPEAHRGASPARGTCSSAPWLPGLPAHAVEPGSGTRYRASTPQRPLQSESGPHHCAQAGGGAAGRQRPRGRPLSESGPYHCGPGGGGPLSQSGLYHRGPGGGGGAEMAPTAVVPLAPSRTYHHPRWGSGQ